MAKGSPTKNPVHAVFVSSDKILKKLHETDMSQAELARHLKKIPSQISRGLHNQRWLRTNLAAIASILRTEEAKLCMQMAEVERQSAVSGSAVDYACGAARNGSYALPEGCEIRAILTPGAPQPTWHIVGPANVVPRDNDIVEVELKDGSRHLRIYSQDAQDPDTLVLWSRDKSERPMVRMRKDIKDLRVVLTVVLMPRGSV